MAGTMEKTGSTPEHSERAKQDRDSEIEAWFTEERLERFAASFEQAPCLWRAAHIPRNEKSSRWTSYMQLLDSLGGAARSAPSLGGYSGTDDLALQARAMALCRVFRRLLRDKLRWAAGESVAGGTGADVALALCPAWARRADGYLRLLPLLLLHQADKQNKVNHSKPGPKPRVQKPKENKMKVIEPAAPSIVNHEENTNKISELKTKAVTQKNASRTNKTKGGQRTGKTTKALNPLAPTRSEDSWKPSAEGRLLMRRIVCGMGRAAYQCGGLTREAAAIVAKRIGNTESRVYALWCSMRQIATYKLRTLLARGDIPSKSAPARLGYLDWAVADLLMLYEFNPVTEESFKNNNQQHALLLTFHLVLKLGLETAAGQQPAATWHDAAQRYCRGNVKMSAVGLQRRWHEMKLQTRERLRAHLRGDTSVQELPIHRNIAAKYPHILTYPVRPWRELVAEGSAAPPTAPNPPRQNNAPLDRRETCDGDVVMVDDGGTDAVQSPSNDIVLLDDDLPEDNSNDSHTVDAEQHIEVQSNNLNESDINNPVQATNTVDDREIIDLDAISDETSILNILPKDICTTVERILNESNEKNTKNSLDVQGGSSTKTDHSNISKNKNRTKTNFNNETASNNNKPRIVPKVGTRDLIKEIEREMFHNSGVSKTKKTVTTQNCTEPNTTQASGNASDSSEKDVRYPMLTQMLQYTCIFDDDEKFNSFMENNGEAVENNSKTPETNQTQHTNEKNNKPEPRRKEKRRKRAWHEVHSDWADQIVSAVKKQRQESERLKNSPIHQMVTVDQINGVIDKFSKICESNNMDGGKIEKILRSYLVSTISQKEVIDLEKTDSEEDEANNVADSGGNYDDPSDDSYDEDDAENNIDPKLLMYPTVMLTRIEEDPALRIVSAHYSSISSPSPCPSPTTLPSSPLPNQSSLLTELLSTNPTPSNPFSSPLLSSLLSSTNSVVESSLNLTSQSTTISPKFLFNIKTRALLKKCKPCVVLLERLDELEGRGGENERGELQDTDVRWSDQNLRTAQIAPLTAGSCPTSTTESCDSDWSPEEDEWSRTEARAQELKQYDDQLSRLLKDFLATTPTNTTARRKSPKKSRRKQPPQTSSQQPEETPHSHTSAPPPPPAPRALSAADAQAKTLKQYARDVREKLARTSRWSGQAPEAETMVANAPTLIREELPEPISQLNAFKDFHRKLNMLAEGKLPAPPPYPGKAYGSKGRPPTPHFDPVITGVCSLAPQANRREKTAKSRKAKPRQPRSDPYAQSGSEFPPKAVVPPNPRLPQFDSIRHPRPLDVPPLRYYQNKTSQRANGPRNFVSSMPQMQNMVQQYPQMNQQRLDSRMAQTRFSSQQTSNAPWNQTARPQPAYMPNPNLDPQNPSQASSFIAPNLPDLSVPGFPANLTQGGAMPARALQPNVMYGITINQQPNFAMQRQTYTGPNTAASKRSHGYYGAPNTAPNPNAQAFSRSNTSNASSFGHSNNAKAALELTCSNTSGCKVSFEITGSNTGSAQTGFTGSSASSIPAGFSESNGSRSSFYGANTHEVPLTFEPPQRQSVIMSLQASEPQPALYEVEITPQPVWSPSAETTSSEVSEGSASNEPASKCWRWAPVPGWQWARHRDPLSLVVLGTPAERPPWPLLGRYLVVSEREPPPDNLDVWALSPRVRLQVPPDTDGPGRSPAAASGKIQVKSFARLDPPAKEGGAGLGGAAPARVPYDGCVYLKLGVEPLIYAKLLVAVRDARACRALLARAAPLLLYCLQSCRLFPLRAEPNGRGEFALSGGEEVFPAVQQLVQQLHDAGSSHGQTLA